MQQRFLLQILLLAQHVSGTTMPIIRSSRVLKCSVPKCSGKWCSPVYDNHCALRHTLSEHSSYRGTLTQKPQCFFYNIYDTN